MAEYLYRDRERQQGGKRRGESVSYKEKKPQENFPGYVPHRNMQFTLEERQPVQLLRLRLNDKIIGNDEETERKNLKDNTLFDKMRKVDVSPPSFLAASNRPAATKLQQANMPNFYHRSAKEHKQDRKDEFSEYGPPSLKSSSPTLEENEDIIFEGHGGETGIETYSPQDLAEKAARIIKECGYTEAKQWKGRVVLFACSSGGIAQTVADCLSQKLKYSVCVIGLQREVNIFKTREKTEDPLYYAAYRWEKTDVGAPKNLEAIIQYYEFIERFMREVVGIRGSIGKLSTYLGDQNNRTKHVTDYKQDNKASLEVFENCYKAIKEMTPPEIEQPNRIVFKQGELPGKTDHYGSPCDQSSFLITPWKIADIKNDIENGLGEIQNTTKTFDEGGTISDLGLPGDSLVSLKKITENISKVIQMWGSFLIARYRRIDFQNDKDIVKASGKTRSRDSLCTIV